MPRRPSQSNLSASDCICPICLSLLIEPVSLPCKHDLCLKCFQQTVEECTLTCPVCRNRIANWARQARKDKALVNEKLWKKIQKAFPDKVKKRLNANDDDVSEDELEPVRVCQPGEIRKEYEERLKQFEEEERKQKEEEEAASLALIKKLEDEGVITRQAAAANTVYVADSAIRELQEKLEEDSSLNNTTYLEGFFAEFASTSSASTVTTVTPGKRSSRSCVSGVGTPETRSKRQRL